MNHYLPNGNGEDAEANGHKIHDLRNQNWKGDGVDISSGFSEVMDSIKRGEILRIHEFYGEDHSEHKSFKNMPFWKMDHRMILPEEHRNKFTECTCYGANLAFVYKG